MYTIIDSLLTQFPISINSACSCLNISRSQYYDWKIRNDSLNQSDPFEIQIKGNNYKYNDYIHNGNEIL
ncbi:MAG: hypothetical protein C5S41_05890 [Candidatus Methanomarinus sp.]|nr:MAG: hypothetical protein C5S41_05890 [ANME-2 cluster archaeon]